MRPPIVKVNAPVPYSGGKDAVGAVVWQRFGDVRNLVIPFAGMLGILRARPWPPANGKPYTETVNDLDGGLSNALRALALRPDEVVEALTIRIGDEPDEARTIRPTSELDQRAFDLLQNLLMDTLIGSITFKKIGHDIPIKKGLNLMLKRGLGCQIFQALSA